MSETRKWTIEEFVNEWSRGDVWGNIVDSDGKVICEVRGALDSGSNRDHAHLIAAAPDLYAALDALLSRFLDDLERDLGRELRERDIPIEARKARAALSRARGDAQ